MNNSIYLDHIILCDGELCIDRLEYTDLPKFVEIRNLCREFLHNNSEFSLWDVQNWFNAIPDPYFKITFNNEIIGYIRSTNWDTEHSRCEIGLDIHPDFQGKKLAQRAYRLFLGYLFDKLEFHKVSLEVLDFNTRGLHLYEKIGFKVEGRKREEILRDGKWCDSILMSILRNEWVA